MLNKKATGHETAAQIVRTVYRTSLGANCTLALARSDGWSQLIGGIDQGLPRVFRHQV